jgi:protein gp37
MSTHTAIHFCDGTVNPVMGCEGCELLPSRAALLRELAASLAPRLQVPVEEMRLIVRARALVIEARGPTGDLALLTGIATGALGEGHTQADVSTVVRHATRDCRCYAAALTERYGGTNHGFPAAFREIAVFPGRMATAARSGDLFGRRHPDKRWLDGYPRIWFISDMGDALCLDDFEYFRREIIEVVTSEGGRRHIWLWITKRPGAMAEFYRWLQERGIEWPQNLMPMTTVTSAATLNRVALLCQVDARMRGLSVEPLVGPVTLPLEGIDWVIVGGESGTNARPFDIRWAEDIRRQCDQAGVAFFLKQLGARPVRGGQAIRLDSSHGSDWLEWPEELRTRAVPNAFREVTIR